MFNAPMIGTVVLGPHATKIRGSVNVQVSVASRRISNHACIMASVDHAQSTTTAMEE